tara:strand:- start:324 stop:797 length:474 start_codon:yes stop_codon:yes gene_type:complete
MTRRTISQVERSAILDAWGRKCAYCDKKSGNFEVEHIIPKSKGGSCRLENLCISCVRCNRKKRDTLLPKMYEGILLGIAQRKAMKVRKLVDKRRRFDFVDSPELAVFGRDYVRKYLWKQSSTVKSVRGNTHKVTQDDLRRYEVRVHREVSLRKLEGK